MKQKTEIQPQKREKEYIKVKKDTLKKWKAGLILTNFTEEVCFYCKNFKKQNQPIKHEKNCMFTEIDNLLKLEK